MSEAVKKLEPKLSLLNLASQVNALTERIIENGGELDPDTESALMVNEKDLAVKVDSYAIIRDRFAFEVEYLKAKAAEFTAAARALENAKSRLDENLKLAFRMLNASEISGESYKFKLQNNKPKLIINEELLPQEFKIQVISYEPDKSKIQDALSAGLEVPGAQIEVGTHIRKYVAKGKS